MWRQREGCVPVTKPEYVSLGFYFVLGNPCSPVLAKLQPQPASPHRDFINLSSLQEDSQGPGDPGVPANIITKYIPGTSGTTFPNQL